MIRIHKKGVRSSGHRLRRHFAYVITIETKLSIGLAEQISRWCLENLGTFPRDFLFDWKKGTVFVHTAEAATLFKLYWTDAVK